MSSVKQYIAEEFLNLDCGLGEGPHWEEEKNILRFVDIFKNQIHTVNLDIGPSSHQVFSELDISIGTTADIEGREDAFVFGGKHGYGIFDKKTKSYKYIKKVWNQSEIDAGHERRLRANDGGVDCRGRFFLGFMTDPLVESELKDEGVFFRLDPDLSLHRVFEGVTIPNGISWTNDGKTMYFTDTATKAIDACDYDVETGGLSNRRTFFRLEGDGAPDGHAHDVNDCLWVCLAGGGKVIHISPKGEVLGEIKLPMNMPTCPVICGQDIYITSAAEAEKGKKPKEGSGVATRYGGSVFKCHIGVRGQIKHRFHSAGSS